jgi:hypothetical protein
MDDPLFVVRIPAWYTPAAGAMCLAFGVVLWRKARAVRGARILAVAIAIGLPVFIALYARHGVVVFDDRIAAVWRFGSGVVSETTVYRRMTSAGTKPGSCAARVVRIIKA